MKPHPKYPETLIAYACQKAYAALRKHYGPDSNDVTRPRDVEQAIRRDVIAVIDGATAKRLHALWLVRQQNRLGYPKTGWNYWQAQTENPTLDDWQCIPDHDKAGYRLFCRTVHEARRAWGCWRSSRGPSGIGELALRGRGYASKVVDEVDAFLASKGHTQFQTKPEKCLCFVYCGKASGLLKAVQEYLESDA